MLNSTWVCGGESAFLRVNEGVGWGAHEGLVVREVKNYKGLGSINAIRAAVSAGWQPSNLGFRLPWRLETGPSLR